MTTTDPDSKSPDEDLVAIPGFRQPPPPKVDPLDSSTTTITSSSPSSTASPEDEWSGPADELDELLDELLDEPSSSKGSTTSHGPSRASIADWREFAPVIHQLVALASFIVRIVRTRRRPLPDGVWLADDEDLEAIGDPLARIAARHSPLEGGESTSDVVDGIMVAVGTAGYAIKNLNEEQASEPLVPDQGTGLGLVE